MRFGSCAWEVAFPPSSLGPAHFMKPLGGLHVMSFNVMTSNNDCNLIPLVGMLGASKVYIMLDCNFSCNLRTEV